MSVKGMLDCAEGACAAAVRAGLTCPTADVRSQTLGTRKQLPGWILAGFSSRALSSEGGGWRAAALEELVAWGRLAGFPTGTASPPPPRQKYKAMT